MFAEVAPTIVRLRSLQRAFPITHHFNSYPLPIPMDCVLHMSSPPRCSSSRFVFSITIPASPLPIFLHVFSSGVAQNMMPICRSSLLLFFTMCGTLSGSLPLIPPPLFVTVSVLGARAKKRLYH
eukprot:g14231.t1